VGCIASTRRFFPEGKLSKKRWNEALTEGGTEFEQFAAQYNGLGWQEALGSSGTHKTIAKICTAMKLAKGEITADALPVLPEALLTAKRIEDIHLP
ncbi:exopolyphosphatase, partial [Xylella fastidiosa subsp. multiplex]|nr:exopolyphosphatase [Xylella fastidiosa subsp. multiplex]